MQKAAGNEIDLPYFTNRATSCYLSGVDDDF